MPVNDTQFYPHLHSKSKHVIDYPDEEKNRKRNETLPKKNNPTKSTQKITVNQCLFSCGFVAQSFHRNIGTQKTHVAVVSEHIRRPD